MKHFGLKISEGSEVTNLTAPTGTAFPSNPNAGELFYRTDGSKLYCDDGSSWNDISGIVDVLADTSPQLGGELDVMALMSYQLQTMPLY